MTDIIEIGEVIEIVEVENVIELLDLDGGVQGLAGFHHDGRFQRESVDLVPLLLQGQLVAFHELRVDALDFAVFMAASVDYEVDATILGVMLFQILRHGVNFG